MARGVQSCLSSSHAASALLWRATNIMLLDASSSAIRKNMGHMASAHAIQTSRYAQRKRAPSFPLQ